MKDDKFRNLKCKFIMFSDGYSYWIFFLFSFNNSLQFIDFWLAQSAKSRSLVLNKISIALFSFFLEYFCYCNFCCWCCCYNKKKKKRTLARYTMIQCGIESKHRLLLTTYNNIISIMDKTKISEHLLASNGFSRDDSVIDFVKRKGLLNLVRPIPP
jgi:hypothetical protein